MRLVSFIVLILLSLDNLFASDCRCYPNHESKRYFHQVKKWYGKKVSYSCQYLCHRQNDLKDIIFASHEKTIIGAEQGYEAVCDGTIYTQTYSTSSHWFYWRYDKSYWFDPSKSTSPDLKQWSKEYCK